ncbi:MAG: RNA methyltransferase, partial [Thermoprotei archaeon]
MYDVPFVATPEHVARRMLEMAQVGPGDIVYDLGAGDGRILIMAAREFGARAVGIELRKDLFNQIERK